MAFEESPDVHVDRDENERVRVLWHPDEPFTPERARLAAPSRRELADEYVRQVLELYGIDQDEIADLTGEIPSEPVDEGPRLRFGEEKTILDSTVVSYTQTCLGLPVWQAALEIRIYGDPPRVVGSDSTLHHDINIDAASIPNDSGAAVGVVALRESLELDEATAQSLVINSARMLVYRYDPDNRLDPTAGEPGLQGGPPVLPLAPVPDTIEPGRHYVVREVLFTLPLPGWNDLPWDTLVEPQTGAVLYLRALAVSAVACVFATDPVTATGTALTGCSPTGSLDPLRTTVTLLGLDPPDSSGSQALRGTHVVLTDTDQPTVPPPTTTPPFSFCYSADTNDFAAANAYYHYDGAYRLMKGMGFKISGPNGYFDGTTFPVPVDHQGVGTDVAAFAIGNTAKNGMGKFINGRAAAGCSVGIAADVRVVLHEFGHALLWDHVNDPNFGWCHSAGDTLGAILHDPGSSAPDRFRTFPFSDVVLRRHDRNMAAGWAWGGAQDDGQYGSEQILSTTLFRVYRSTGGDDANINIQRFAARYLAFLIIKAIGTLTVTTGDPKVYVTALMEADKSTASFEGHPGGAWHKVIRWSFECQGLYQPPGAPTPVTQPGAPPPVDVYIDDGRSGDYMPYLANPSVTADIWNRRNPDGTVAHEEPMVGVTNHAYLRVRNRGTQAATNVTVKLFQADPADGLTWPTGWTPASTPQLNALGTISPGGQIVVGPFDWVAQIANDELLLASVSAPGDPSNADSVNGSLAVQQLVPFDNNIAMRRVSPIIDISFEAKWITGLYADLLSRAPDQAGLNGGLAARQTGMSLGKVVNGFLNSNEYCTALVTGFYVDLLARQPDPAGFQFWVGQLQTGAARHAIQIGFLDSAEYKANNPSSDQFVESLYSKLLMRTSDPVGKQGWIDALAAGASTADVIRGFLMSQEYCTQRVTELYAALLGRSPDPAGLAGWVGLMMSGAAFQEIQRGFLTSNEYRLHRQGLP